AGKETITRLALEFLILTAARSGEVRFATMNEIDLKHAIWTIPEARMKSKKEHQVPLSERCLELLEEAQRLRPRGAALIFPNSGGRSLSDMALVKLMRDMGWGARAVPHGFRSSFRDWATEVARVREVVAEAALAHTVRDKTEAAYRRAFYIKDRTQLM